MTGQEEADRVIFAPQPFRRNQGSTCGSMMAGASAAPPNMSFCPSIAASWLRWQAARISVRAGKHARPIRLERIERAGPPRDSR